MGTSPSHHRYRHLAARPRLTTTPRMRLSLGRWGFPRAPLSLPGVAQSCAPPLWNLLREHGRVPQSGARRRRVLAAHEFSGATRSAADEPQRRDRTERAGRAAYAARAVVLIIIGIFFIVAAVQHDPQEAIGLSGALETIAEQPGNPVGRRDRALHVILRGASPPAHFRRRAAACSTRGSVILPPRATRHCAMDSARAVRCAMGSWSGAAPWELCQTPLRSVARRRSRLRLHRGRVRLPIRIGTCIT